MQSQSAAGSGAAGQGGNNSRSHSHDYDNPGAKANIYKNSSHQKPDQQTGAISSGGNNVIMEMEAENNEDESYYLSNSPVKRAGASSNISGLTRSGNHNTKSTALCNNGTGFGGPLGSFATMVGSMGPQGDNVHPSI